MRQRCGVRFGGLMLWVALCARGAAPAAAAICPQAATWPGVAAHVASAGNLVVGEVIIEASDVFDPDGPGLSGIVARTGNRLHVKTRERVIRRELLFRPGQPFDPEKLAQTERNLRALGLFRRVEVIPLQPRDGVVAVRVRVSDAWSLGVGMSFSREGGFSAYDLRLRDRNVAGLGTRIAVRRALTFDRTEQTASVEDPRLFGTRECFSAAYASRTDGLAREVWLSRPFLTIDAPAGHEFGWRLATQHYRAYRDGVVAAEYGLRESDGMLGWISTMAASSEEGWAWRVGGGYRYRAQVFSNLPGAQVSDSVPMPESHRYGGPFLVVQRVRHQFEKRSTLIAPDRDVDYNLGLNASVELWVSRRGAGPSTENRVLASLRLERGWRAGEAALVVAAATAGAEWAGGRLARGTLAASAHGWWPHSPRRVTAVMVAGESWIHPDPAARLYLGGTPGLRGFIENRFSGTRSLLVIVEERQYFDWRPLAIVQPGVAVFAELGAIGGGPEGARSRALHGDVGIGLRLAHLKAAGPNVIKVDLAIPVGERWRGRRGLQLVVGLRREF